MIGRFLHFFIVLTVASNIALAGDKEKLKSYADCANSLYLGITITDNYRMMPATKQGQKGFFIFGPDMLQFFPYGKPNSSNEKYDYYHLNLMLPDGETRDITISDYKGGLNDGTDISLGIFSKGIVPDKDIVEEFKFVGGGVTTGDGKPLQDGSGNIVRQGSFMDLKMKAKIEANEKEYLVARLKKEIELQSDHFITTNSWIYRNNSRKKKGSRQEIIRPVGKSRFESRIKVCEENLDSEIRSAAKAELTDLANLDGSTIRPYPRKDITPIGSFGTGDGQTK